ncbi:hypothetical protein NPIL_248351 [Nephila pilipes]|uniref:Uncharacterized protein n=1 Tax=Nephila pilipes TaxID=299642 RepID=A0A8X6P7I8_NEPPI|nr:hypothetical protein NPIL_248351 [Nephila pilipes]
MSEHNGRTGKCRNIESRDNERDGSISSKLSKKLIKNIQPRCVGNLVEPKDVIGIVDASSKSVECPPLLLVGWHLFEGDKSVYVRFEHPANAIREPSRLIPAQGAGCRWEEILTIPEEDPG